VADPAKCLSPFIEFSELIEELAGVEVRTGVASYLVAKKSNDVELLRKGRDTKMSFFLFDA